MAIKQIQVFATTDGKQFTDMAAAEAHQTMLDNSAGIEKVATSFANIISAPGSKEVGLVGRTRVFNMNVASQVVSFLIAQGVISKDDLEAFDAIEASDELQGRLDAEEAAAKVKAEAAAAKKLAEGKGAETGVEPKEEAPVENLFD